MSEDFKNYLVAAINNGKIAKDEIKQRIEQEAFDNRTGFYPE